MLPELNLESNIWREKYLTIIITLLNQGEYWNNIYQPVKWQSKYSAAIYQD